MNSLIQDLRLSAIVPAIRHEVAALDKNAPVSEISTMKEILAGPVLQVQTVMWLLGALRCPGADSCRHRNLRRQFLCSDPAHARTRHSDGPGRGSSSCRESGGAAGAVSGDAGVVTGWAGALGMARFVSRLPFEVRWLLLFDVPPTDTLKFDSVSAILTIVAFLDSYVPARRAPRVDPIVALRHE